MKKNLLCSIVALILLAQSCSCVLAKNVYYNSRIKVAIKKYKAGNYTGCLEDCLRILKTEKKNPIAYYYLAISQVQANQKEDAIKSYNKVLSYSTNPKLREYATTGKRCIETPDQCILPTSSKGKTENLSDLDKFILSPNNFSPAVNKDFHQKHLDDIRNQINNNKDLDNYNFQKMNKNIENDKIAQKPTEEEINAALKVLKDAGINQNTVNNNSNNITEIMNQNPEMMELNAMMGGNQSNNNSMLNMLPYMMMQNKTGTNNYSPQAMQAVIMNSMMSDFNYNIDVDKDK